MKGNLFLFQFFCEGDYQNVKIGIMYPILGRVGSIVIFSFTAVLGAGLLAGWSLAAWQNRDSPLPGWQDALIVILAAGFGGSRLGFVAGAWGYFQERPSDIFRFWQGGLSYLGALLAGTAALWLWSRGQQRTFGPLADRFAPSLALLSAFGWFGCWLDRCGVGRTAPPGTFTANLPDQFGLFASRYQTQMMGTAAGIMIFIVIWQLRRRRPSGQLFWLTVALLSTAQGGISLLREETAVRLGPFSLDMLLNIALGLISLLLIQYIRSTTRR